MFCEKKVELWIILYFVMSLPLLMMVAILLGIEALREARCPLLSSWVHSFKRASFSWGREETFTSFSLFISFHQFTIGFKSCEFLSQSVTSKVCSFRKYWTIFPLGMGPYPEESACSYSCSSSPRGRHSGSGGTSPNSWFCFSTGINPSRASISSIATPDHHAVQLFSVFDHVAGVKTVQSGWPPNLGSCGLQATEHALIGKHYLASVFLCPVTILFGKGQLLSLHFLHKKRFLSRNPPRGSLQLLQNQVVDVADCEAGCLRDLLFYNAGSGARICIRYLSRTFRA